MSRRRQRGEKKTDIDPNTIELECVLAKAWGELYSSGTNCDVTFIVGQDQREIRAHRLVLATHSETFRALLYNGMEETSQPRIKLPEHAPVIFEQLVRFLYTGQVKVSRESVKELIILADYYATDLLKESCGEWIGKNLLDRTTVCEYVVFATVHNVHSLCKMCYRFMLGNAKDIFFLSEFRSTIPLEILEKLVVSDELNLTEIELFRALVLWGEHKIAVPNTQSFLKLAESDLSDDSEDDKSSEVQCSPETAKLLKTQLEPLISHVRLPFIDPEQLLEVIQPTCLFDQSLILQALKHHISKKPVYEPYDVQIRPRRNTIQTKYSLMKNREPHKTQTFLHSETAGGEDDSSSW